MFRSIQAILLLTLFSCATRPKLSEIPIDAVLNSVKVTGEGRGRLGLEQGSYVFSFDALLKEEDWLLAVSVPLQGEEVMILPRIREPSSPKDKLESFEVRLEREITTRIKGSELTGRDFIRELRSLIRFILAPQLSLNRVCEMESEKLYQCKLEKDFFLVKLRKNKFFIHKLISENYLLELSAENLTDSFFTRTKFHLHSKKRSKMPDQIMSLELFWK